MANEKVVVTTATAKMALDKKGRLVKMCPYCKEPLHYTPTKRCPHYAV